MGAHPKRRISTARAGRRQKGIKIDSKQTKHHAVPSHKQGLVAKIKKLLAVNE